MVSQLYERALQTMLNNLLGALGESWYQDTIQNLFRYTDYFVANEASGQFGERRRPRLGGKMGLGIVK
jgi:hypothetical protein